MEAFGKASASRCRIEDDSACLGILGLWMELCLSSEHVCSCFSVASQEAVLYRDLFEQMIIIEAPRNMNINMVGNPKALHVLHQISIHC